MPRTKKCFLASCISLLTLCILFSFAFAFSASAAEPCSVGMNGDVTGDGKTDIMDATRIMKILAGWDVQGNGDIDKDGNVTLLDATLLMKYLAGWNLFQDGHLPVHVDRVEPTDHSAGHTEGTRCPFCGKVLSGCAVIPQLSVPENLFTVEDLPDGSGVRITGVTDTAVTSVGIPETLNGKAVKEIGRSAFSQCRQLTSVAFCNSLVKIHSNAFLDVPLTSAHFPQGTQWYWTENDEICKDGQGSKLDFTDATNAAYILRGGDPFGGNYGELIPLP